MDGQLDKRTDGRMEGLTNGQRDKQTGIKISVCLSIFFSPGIVDIARGLMENFIILEDIFGVKIIKLKIAF